jgi:arylsulfatase A-like enzyme
MKTHLSILSLLLLTAAAGVFAAERKPNVVIFLCDDVGWAEFGFQGKKDIPTPNIDRIAANGIRFPQAYVSGTYCSPTRAGLMTGRYQTRFGHEFNGVCREGTSRCSSTYRPTSRKKTICRSNGPTK